MADTMDHENVEDYRRTAARRRGFILVAIFIAFFVICFFAYGF